MENIQLLIKNIKQSDLSENDKDTLIKILADENNDFDKFIKTFLLICKIGKEALKLFDIDIGDS